jgi:hypothetical protein
MPACWSGVRGRAVQAIVLGASIGCTSPETVESVRVVAGSRFRRNRSHLGFDIHSIDLVDSTHAIVESGYDESSLSAAGYRVVLEWTSGRWIVTERKLLMIA